MLSKQKTPMKLALIEAQKAFSLGEVPIGAVILEGPSRRIITSTHNKVEELLDPTAHAEMLAIRAATSILGVKTLSQCTIFVTLEPCAMCAQAISLAKIKRLVFGAYDPKGGGVEHGGRIFQQASCNHRPELIGGVEETASANLLKAFFLQKRNAKE